MSYANRGARVRPGDIVWFTNGKQAKVIDTADKELPNGSVVNYAVLVGFGRFRGWFLASSMCWKRVKYMSLDEAKRMKKIQQKNQQKKILNDLISQEIISSMSNKQIEEAEIEVKENRLKCEKKMKMKMQNESIKNRSQAREYREFLQRKAIDGPSICDMMIMDSIRQIRKQKKLERKWNKKEKKLIKEAMQKVDIAFESSVYEPHCSDDEFSDGYSELDMHSVISWTSYDRHKDYYSHPSANHLVTVNEEAEKEELIAPDIEVEEEEEPELPASDEKQGDINWGDDFVSIEDATNDEFIDVVKDDTSNYDATLFSHHSTDLSNYGFVGFDNDTSSEFNNSNPSSFSFSIPTHPIECSTASDILPQPQKSQTQIFVEKEGAWIAKRKGLEKTGIELQKALELLRFEFIEKSIYEKRKSEILEEEVHEIEAARKEEQARKAEQARLEEQKKKELELEEKRKKELRDQESHESVGKGKGKEKGKGVDTKGSRTESHGSGQGKAHEISNKSSTPKRGGNDGRGRGTDTRGRGRGRGIDTRGSRGESSGAEVRGRGSGSERGRARGRGRGTDIASPQGSGEERGRGRGRGERGRGRGRSEVEAPTRGRGRGIERARGRSQGEERGRGRGRGRGERGGRGSNDINT